MRNLFTSCLERFHRIFMRPVRQIKRVADRGRTRRAHLALELLEDRLVPATYYVNNLADLSIAAGVNSATGAIVGTNHVVTLRSAIDAANMTPGGNTIELMVPGTYNISLPGAGTGTDATGAFAILPGGGNLSIINASGGGIVVNGNHLDRVFDINPSFNAASPTPAFAVTLEGFTITGGVTAPFDGPSATGGGIRDQGNASLTLTNMVITNNVATADGGGVSMENTVSEPWRLTINNSLISNNHAGDAGGGVEEDGTGKVVINAGTVITNNTCVNQGAGIWLDAIADPNNASVLQTASLTVTGTLISNNQALTGPGGGIGNSGTGAVTIVSSTLENNAAAMDGGGFADQNNQGTLTVVNSLFLNNVASGDGGGIQEGGPTTSITNTEISSGAAGGGLFANGTTLFVQNCTIANNTASGLASGLGGGGIEVETTGTGLNASTIINTTITGNRALNNTDVVGGGIDAATLAGDLVLQNDTINANFAFEGGGIFWEGFTGTLTVENTILAGNSALSGVDASGAPGTFTDLGGNLIGVAGDANAGFTAGTTQTGNLANPLNPLLAPLGNYGGPVIGGGGVTIVLQTEALQTGSPAIGKGILSRAPAYDERGVLNFLNNAINVGAVSDVVPLPKPLPTFVSTSMPLVSHKMVNGVLTTTYLVNSTLDTHTPAAGTLTLRDAIDMANNATGNKIIELLVAGDYKITLPGANTGTNASGAFAILPSGGNVTILNASGGTATVDGNHFDRVFDINPADDVNFNDEFTVTLQGITITNGIAQSGDGATGTGGGIRDQGIASLTLNNDVITNNLATADGGGLSMENTASSHWVLTINNSIISDNHAGDAGGGVEEDGSSKVFINSGTIIVGNTCVNQGAGIWLDAIQDPNNANALDTAALTVTGAFIADNDALDMLGGGIGNSGNGPVTIVSCTIQSNFAGGTGGGFADANNQGTLLVQDSLFLSNFAVGSGGGIQEGGPSTTIISTEIAGNESGNTGGGLFANGAVLIIKDSTIANNIAAGSGTGQGGGGIELDTSGPSSITASTITGNRAINNNTTTGGGIDAPDLAGTLALVNDTINNNFADYGGGIYWGGTNESAFSVENTILAQNYVGLGGDGVDAFNEEGSFTDIGGNLIGVAGDFNTGFSAVTDLKGTLQHPLNPWLEPLGNYGGPVIGSPGHTLVIQTEALYPSSPALGKGLKTGAPATDERGAPNGAVITIGAVNV